MKIGWATDIHLDCVRDEALDVFALSVRSSGADVLLLTGDNSNGLRLHSDLHRLRESVGIPVWFVLGNHDSYYGSISESRAECWRRYDDPERLLYLPRLSHMVVSSDTVLIGDDGWYDGRHGNPNTPLMLNDFNLIEEFAYKSRSERRRVMEMITDASASIVHEKVTNSSTLPGVRRILVATHVAPWKEAAWHEGKVSNKTFLPYFSNRSIGVAIEESSATFRSNGGEVLVLCGHSHSPGVHRLPNIECRTGGAQYGSPRLVDVLDFP